MKTPEQRRQERQLLEEMVHQFISARYPRKPKPPEPDRNIYLDGRLPSKEQMQADLIAGRGGWKSIAFSAAEKEAEAKAREEEMQGMIPIPSPEWEEKV